jgi:hypothetical protein
MFHKVRDVQALDGLVLAVEFADGARRLYDVAPLVGDLPGFEALRDAGAFAAVKVDAGGYGVSWSDALDLSCDELWYGGVEDRAAAVS